MSKICNMIDKLTDNTEEIKKVWLLHLENGPGGDASRRRDRRLSWAVAAKRLYYALYGFDASVNQRKMHMESHANLRPGAQAYTEGCWNCVSLDGVTAVYDFKDDKFIMQVN